MFLQIFKLAFPYFPKPDYCIILWVSFLLKGLRSKVWREKRNLENFYEEETNQYKRNALESELRSVENSKKLLTNLLQSLQSEPSGCEGASERNPELASSEGSPPFPFSSEAIVGGRGVG